MDQQTQTKEVENQERWEVLGQLEDLLEGPVIFLGFVWLALLLVELIWGLNPVLEVFGTIIWIIFIVDFALRFWLAPQKLFFLRRNWLTALSLFVPALRVLRITRFARLVRLAPSAGGLRLVKVVGSINRGMGALKNSLGRRGFGYVAALTLLVTFLGAGGLFSFEKGMQTGFSSYSESLWRTAMVMTTMGTGAEPKTMEGRALVLFLALFAFAVFGYITASLATFFIGHEKQSTPEPEIAALREEIAQLRNEIQQAQQNQKPSDQPPG